MNLRFIVNWIGDFLKQLYANVPKQLIAILEDPTAPRIRARTKTLLHPRSTSAHKPRFGFRSRFGFSSESIAKLCQSIAIG